MEGRATGLNCWCRNSLCNHLFGSIPVIPLFRVVARELPGALDLKSLSILPDKFCRHGVGQASIHQEYSSLLCLGIITGRNIQGRHSTMLLCFYVWCFEVKI